jgi:NAD(P)-dependent dehydrogenase (short-subunit alcohol dehydrogenase family)
MTSSFGKNTTAQQAIAGISLAGKRALVTGAASGIGVETATALRGAGAEVIEGVRKSVDLSDFASIRAFASSLPPLDLVVCNAGVMASPLMYTKQGFELQMGTNHVGHFLLVTSLLEKLTPNARVVVVASAAHNGGRNAAIVATLSDDKSYAKRKYKPFGAYGDSKLANIHFARALSKRLQPGQRAFSLHPGVIATNLVRHMGLLGSIYSVVGKPFMKSTQQGAATSIVAATAELPSGAYLSDCREKAPSVDAQDAAFSEKLWEMSAELTSH